MECLKDPFSNVILPAGFGYNFAFTGKITQANDEKTFSTTLANFYVIGCADLNIFKLAIFQCYKITQNIQFLIFMQFI